MVMSLSPILRFIFSSPTVLRMAPCFCLNFGIRHLLDSSIRLPTRQRVAHFSALRKIAVADMRLYERRVEFFGQESAGQVGLKVSVSIRRARL